METSPTGPDPTSETVIVLLRHGRAEPSSPHGDRDRALAPGADADVRRTVERIARHRPVRALVSPARRTRQTFAACREALPDVTAEEVGTIYEASAAQLLALIEAAGPSPLLVVGHNPGLTAAASAMSGGAFRHAMRPADAVVLAWDRTARTGRLVEHVRPHPEPSEG